MKDVRKDNRGGDDSDLVPKQIVSYETGSFEHRRSSEIRKMLPKNPGQAVKVLRHIFDQFKKSPRKGKLLEKYWEEDR